jgi:hypothetical protein
MVVFDQADVESSGVYLLMYERVDVPSSGGFISIPEEFVPNLIIGLTNFTADRTLEIIHFQWNFTEVNGVYGLQMAPAVPWVDGAIPVSMLDFSYFYLKTWLCPNDTFFDPAQNLCTECPVLMCLNCLSLWVCGACEEGTGFFLNLVSGRCETCMDGCLNCTNLSACSLCDTSRNYSLLENGVCLKCKAEDNYFLNLSSLKC